MPNPLRKPERSSSAGSGLTGGIQTIARQVRNLWEWAGKVTEAINYLQKLTGVGGITVSHFGGAPVIRFGAPVVHILGKAADPIPGRSGNIPGSGPVIRWRPPSSGTGAWVATDVEITAYNFSEADVAADTFLQFKLVDGLWLVDYEDCS